MPRKVSSASANFTELGLMEAAAVLGRSPTTLKTWFNIGCPVVERGAVNKKWKINPAAVIAWREERVVQDAVGENRQVDFEEARRRKMAAEAAMSELDLAQRRQELVPVEDIAAIIGEEYSNLRAKLLAIPTKLAPQLQGVEELSEAKAVIELAITDAMEELTADGMYSGYGVEEGDSQEEGEPKAAA
jgi:phage terminase Nu1 subunit (DNA packaging protein)